MDFSGLMVWTIWGRAKQNIRDSRKCWIIWMSSMGCCVVYKHQQVIGKNIGFNKLLDLQKEGDGYLWLIFFLWPIIGTNRERLNETC